MNGKKGRQTESRFFGCFDFRFDDRHRGGGDFRRRFVREEDSSIRRRLFKDYRIENRSVKDLQLDLSRHIASVE